eukprot:TRINITY_DN13500_c0_g1_i1.p1 TRINITY_DN13500_c0_g1~~TRINITY_DN13500_c0_g1_i1.p1  ORF type:complete len:428 (+),score=86.95 TRINITY_DN13500_c0_g1_i1:141-1424(+)
MGEYVPAHISKLFLYNNVEFGLTEETDHEKVLYYFPHETDENEKMLDVGLSEGLVSFSSMFSEEIVQNCHNEMTRYTFFECEKNWMLVMVTDTPYFLVGDQKEYKDDHLDDAYLFNVLKNIYFEFRMFVDPFQAIFERESEEQLREIINVNMDKILENYFQDEDPSKNLLDILDGIQFLPVNKNIYLQIRSFINYNEQSYRDEIFHSSVIFDECLVYSSLEQEEMKILYSILVRASRTCEKEVGFIFGPADIEDKETTFNSPKINIGVNSYYLVMFKYLTCYFIFLVSENASHNHQFYINLLEILNYQLPILEKNISHDRKKANDEFSYIYFNQMNLALKSSVVPYDMSHSIRTIIYQMHSDLENNDFVTDIVIRPYEGGWVCGKKSHDRELYVLFDNKIGNMNDLSIEVDRLYHQLFSTVFIIPLF